ncbi:aromatic acid exporter family protein [Virgibacillus halophilus]|uniref:Aromatic acid exporter family protein n=1 Tax=Tigheibacillus halophilus TaxID=361280 RepID=A0ABU5C2K1_9BACI|nr:aromatic acid exporter family protein [Virgibacillus halophilus]
MQLLRRLLQLSQLLRIRSKKGIIRFPASAIGSAYAVIFISLFGSTPLTYMLAAVLTIATCFKLKLHAGLLVATLTAVAMVEVIHSNYFLAFFDPSWNDNNWFACINYGEYVYPAT